MISHGTPLLLLLRLALAGTSSIASIGGGRAAGGWRFGGVLQPGERRSDSPPLPPFGVLTVQRAYSGHHALHEERLRAGGMRAASHVSFSLLENIVSIVCTNYRLMTYGGVPAFGG